MTKRLHPLLRGLLILLLVGALPAFAAIREIPVPNSSFEIMFTDNSEGEFTVPYALDERGITHVPIGGDDWGPENVQVNTIGWYSIVDERGGTPLYVFAPMYRPAEEFNDFDHALYGRVVVAVNPHDESFGASDLAEPVTVGTYTVSWALGWTLNTSDAPNVPNVTVHLQYSTDDGATWNDLADASNAVSNREDVVAAMTPGQMRNDLYTAYTVGADSAALGARLRVYVPCNEAEQGGVMDNIRLYHSSVADEIVYDLGIGNYSMELMRAAPAGTPIPNTDRGEDPLAPEDYSEPYLLTQAGVTRVPFGGDNWGPNNRQVWTLGWEGTPTNYDFSPMHYAGPDFTTGYSLETNGRVVQAINPTTALGISDVRSMVMPGRLIVTWGAGRPSGAAEFLDVSTDLEYSTDGENWMSLSTAAEVTSNKADLAASIAEGEFRNDFQSIYTVAADSAAVGGMLRLVVTTTAESDGAVGDRYRVAYVGSTDTGTEMGPGVFSDYVVFDGWVHTEGWLGSVAVAFYPWVYVSLLDIWAYAADGTESDTGAWFFFLKP